MSPEERQLLTGLFDRVRGAAANPRDREAETFINDAVRAQPYAPYLLAQTVLVQEQALRAANDRLQQLEAQVSELQHQVSQPSGGGFLGGLGSLFGGSNPPPRPSTPPPSSSPWGQSQGFNSAPPPSSPWGQQQQFAPPPSSGPWGSQPQGGQWGAPMQGGWDQPQGGMFGGQSQSGGFLKGALGAAAGVAGGVLLADSIRNLMGGHHNGLGIGDGFGALGTGTGTGDGFAGLGNALPNSGVGSGETVINNNYYNNDSTSHAQDTQRDAAFDDSQDASDYSDSDYSTDV